VFERYLSDVARLRSGDDAEATEPRSDRQAG
jgi:hypothetical protein